MKKTVKEVIELVAAGKLVNIKTPAGYQKIGGYAIKGSLDSLEIETANRKTIKVTPAHSFFTTDYGDTNIDPSDSRSKIGAWVPAKKLSIGDTILNEELVSEKVINIKSIGEQPIFDLHVDHPTHSYYGNGLVNHNTGKTLLALHSLVETQKKGGVAILIDAEYAFNHEWYRNLGGDPDNLIHYEPLYIQQVYKFTQDITEKIRKKDKDIPITIVYDSVAASPSKNEYEGAEYDMGKRAQAHGKGIRMLMGLCKQNNVTFISINQLRHTFNMYGLEKDTIGGMAWKYACSLRIRLKKGKKIEEKLEVGKKVIGIAGGAIVEKSRLRAPFSTADFKVFYEYGIDPLAGLFDVCKNEGVIEPAHKDDGTLSRGWWMYKGIKFQEATFEEKVLSKHPELLGGHDILTAIPQNIEIEQALTKDGNEIIESDDGDESVSADF